MKYKIFVISWIIIVFILSSISGNDLHRVPKIQIPHFDKIVHLGMYAILQYFFILNYSKNKIIFKNYLILSIIFSVTYGVLLEFSQQLFFTARTGNIYDAIANTTGVIIVVILYETKFLKKIKLI